MGENIGAAARAMLNFGITDLRIIAPRDGWPNQKAEDMSAGAISIIKSAKVFENTQDALTDITHVFATTARQRDMIKPVYSPRTASETIHSLPKNTKTAILFGAERSGLDNADVTLSNAIITIPVSPDYTSLNLSQAVGIICYEYRAYIQNNIVETKKSPVMATRRQLDDALHHLEEVLNTTNFFRVPEKRPRMTQTIRNMFTRHAFTQQEVQTLRGMIKAIKDTMDISKS
jgi:tRNA/rRNA methyltransferase